MLKRFCAGEISELREVYHSIRTEGYLFFVGFLRKTKAEHVLVILFRSGYGYFDAEDYLMFDISSPLDPEELLIFNMIFTNNYIVFQEDYTKWYEVCFLKNPTVYPYDYPGANKIRNALFHLYHIQQKGSLEELFCKSGLYKLARLLYLGCMDIDSNATNPKAVFHNLLPMKLLRILNHSDGGEQLLRRRDYMVKLRAFYLKNPSEVLNQYTFSAGQCMYLKWGFDREEEVDVRIFNKYKYVHTEDGYYRYKQYMEIQKSLHPMIVLPNPDFKDLESELMAAQSTLFLMFNEEDSFVDVECPEKTAPLLIQE